MAVSIIGPKFYAWDRDGKPLAFGKLYTYQARTNTPKDTYQSEDQVVENPNPVVLNGEGYANVYLDGSYKVVLKDQDENEIWSADPVTAQGGEEWVNCQAATYTTPTSFKITGNVTGNYDAGRVVRIDNNTTEYSYSSIVSSVFAGGETTVTVVDPVILVGMVGVCSSITGTESTKNQLISDLSQDYTFDDVEKYKESLFSFPVGKRIYLKDRQAYFEVISGTGTGNNLDIIDSDQVAQSINYIMEGSAVNVKHIGALGVGASSDDSLALIRAFEISSVVYFPAVESGNYYNILTADLVLADVANPKNNLKLYGDVSADGDVTSAIKFGSGYGIKVNGAVSNYVLQNLTTENLFVGPIDSVSRTTPIFKATGLAYWDRKNCFFQGDTLKEQNVIELLWSLGLTSRNTRVQGGLVGQSLGTVSDPCNSVKLDSDNYNGSRVAVAGACTTFNMEGGLVQSCGDGIQISAGIAESSSSVNIKGVYFENNKFWSGSAFTGRDITVANNGFTRALNIRGNYHAQLAGDNAFTSGQGMSDIPPVRISKVQGFDISTNFWANNGLAEYVELSYFNSGGVAFPRQGDIRNNTDLFTNMTPSTTWEAGTTESEKYFVFENDSVTIKDEQEHNIGVVKTVQSPLFNVTATGVISVPIMESKHYGKITEMRLLCSDGIQTASTLNIGILASATFYASAFPVDNKSSFTTTVITQNNNRIAATNGIIVASLDVTAFTAAGTFSIEIDYIDVLE